MPIGMQHHLAEINIGCFRAPANGPVKAELMNNLIV